MTPLRQRYIDDLRLKNFSPSTIQVYVHTVAKFAQHFGRSPDTLSREEVREYLIYLIDRGSSRSYSISAALTWLSCICTRLPSAAQAPFPLTISCALVSPGAKPSGPPTGWAATSSRQARLYDPLR